MEKIVTNPLPFTGGVKRIQATSEYVGLCKSKVYMLAATGLFPKPITLGPTKAKGWLVCELDAWLMEQASRRQVTGGKKG